MSTATLLLGICSLLVVLTLVSSDLGLILVYMPRGEASGAAAPRSAPAPPSAALGHARSCQLLLRRRPPCRGGAAERRRDEGDRERHHQCAAQPELPARSSGSRP